MRFAALASDYDGTIATEGRVAPSTVTALRRFRECGGVLILATGRDVADLQNIFPELSLFEWLVAENGAVLYQTSSCEETLLAPAPLPALEQALRARGVQPLYVGRVLIGTDADQAAAVREAMQAVQVDGQIILNKGSLMILPSGVDKASGLRALCAKIGLTTDQIAGVGDGENNEALLAACGFAAAVFNALPILKERADWVSTEPAGEGVSELIDKLLSTDTKP